MAIIETVPEIDLTSTEIDDLVEELKDYHRIYSPLFARREQRQWSEKYLHGLLLDIPRKSIEPMVLALEGANPNAVRSMQHFISEGAWHDTPILKQHWKEVDVDLGDSCGVLTIDGSDFPKQGVDSVGVARQYCGELGKVANCQAGVFMGYVSTKGYTLLDRRLYLTEEWVSDDAYADQRRQCGVPKDVTLKTKQELALQMIQAVQAEGSLRFGWVACDASFGRDTVFLDAVASLGLRYYAQIPLDTRVFPQRPKVAVPTWSGRGRKPTRRQLVKGGVLAQPVSELAKSLAASAWSRYTIKEGSQGPIIAEFAVLRVVAMRDGLPGPEVWLVLRRNVLSGELKAYLSNATAETPAHPLVQLSGMRWSIETGKEDSKQLLGLGDYEVRSWRGWHHHMTLCILSHFFVVRMKLRLQPHAPALTLPQARLLLAGVLPKRRFDGQWAIEVLRYRQQRNHAAYLSHRRRRIRKLNHNREVSL